MDASSKGSILLPCPVPRVKKIFNTVSKRAWQAWIAHQTTLINEKFLNLRDASARAYLSEQMERFFDNKDVDVAEGFIDPNQPT